VLLEGRSSKHSDVWSYGVTVWEIYTFAAHGQAAQKPYGDWSLATIKAQLADGYKLPKPVGCPDKVYQLVLRCLEPQPELRLTFDQLLVALNAYAENNALNSSPVPLVSEPGGAAYVNAEAAAAAPRPKLPVARSPQERLEDALALLKTSSPQCNPAEAVRQLMALATAGDLPACYELAKCHAAGIGTPVNAVTAAYWFHQAAQAGNPAAQCQLGLIYSQGTGVQKDVMQGMQWYKLAADQGYALAQNNLGAIYDSGLGNLLAQDCVEAVAWFKRAAEQGHPKAITNLSWAYAWGRGIKKDTVQAARWCKISADSGNATGLYRYAVMLATGTGVTKDKKTAKVLLDRALAAGAKDEEGLAKKLK
jgi:TPR repeat protein